MNRSRIKEQKTSNVIQLATLTLVITFGISLFVAGIAAIANKSYLFIIPFASEWLIFIVYSKYKSLSMKIKSSLKQDEDYLKAQSIKNAKEAYIVWFILMPIINYILIGSIIYIDFQNLYGGWSNYVFIGILSIQNIVIHFMDAYSRNVLGIRPSNIKEVLNTPEGLEAIKIKSKNRGLTVFYTDILVYLLCLSLFIAGVFLASSGNRGTFFVLSVFVAPLTIFALIIISVIFKATLDNKQYNNVMYWLYLLLEILFIVVIFGFGSIGTILNDSWIGYIFIGIFYIVMAVALEMRRYQHRRMLKEE